MELYEDEHRDENGNLYCIHCDSYLYRPHTMKNNFCRWCGTPREFHGERLKEKVPPSDVIFKTRGEKNAAGEMILRALEREFPNDIRIERDKE